jgi:hypothetical protein
MNSSYGPIQNVPEHYCPNVLISDNDFTNLYIAAESTDRVQKYYARDYVVDRFLRCSNTRPEGKSLVDVLAEFPEDELRALFWGVTHCTCCWRHLHNTPVAIDSKIDSSVLNVATIEMVNESNCFCHCRMAKRFLRQAFFNMQKTKLNVA